MNPGIDDLSHIIQQPDTYRPRPSQQKGTGPYTH